MQEAGHPCQLSPNISGQSTNGMHLSQICLRPRRRSLKCFHCRPKTTIFEIRFDLWTHVANIGSITAALKSNVFLVRGGFRCEIIDAQLPRQLLSPRTRATTATTTTITMNKSFAAFIVRTSICNSLYVHTAHCKLHTLGSHTVQIYVERATPINVLEAKDTAPTLSLPRSMERWKWRKWQQQTQQYTYIYASKRARTSFAPLARGFSSWGLLKVSPRKSFDRTVSCLRACLPTSCVDSFFCLCIDRSYRTRIRIRCRKEFTVSSVLCANKWFLVFLYTWTIDSDWIGIDLAETKE